MRFALVILLLVVAGQGFAQLVTPALGQGGKGTRGQGEVRTKGAFVPFTAAITKGALKNPYNIEPNATNRNSVVLLWEWQTNWTAPESFAVFVYAPLAPQWNAECGNYWQQRAIVMTNRFEPEPANGMEFYHVCRLVKDWDIEGRYVEWLDPVKAVHR